MRARLPRWFCLLCIQMLGWGHWRGARRSAMTVVDMYLAWRTVFHHWYCVPWLGELFWHGCHADPPLDHHGADGHVMMMIVMSIMSIHCLLVGGRKYTSLHCPTARGRGLWGTFSTLPHSRQWGSITAPPHCKGTVGSGSPLAHRHTAKGTEHPSLHRCVGDRGLGLPH